MVQFYPWFKFSFLLFLGIVMQDNEFETKENKILIKDKIEPQHRYENYFQVFDSISLLVLDSLMRYSIDHSKKNL